MNKLVNGQSIPMTPEEEAALQSEWAANPPPTATQTRDRRRAIIKAYASGAPDSELSAVVRVLLRVIVARPLTAAAALTAYNAAVDAEIT